MRKFFVAVIATTGFLLLWKAEQTSQAPSLPSIPQAISKLTGTISQRLPANTKKAAMVAKSLDEKKQLLTEIRELQKCYESRACRFPETDPRSYEVGVTQELRKKLSSFFTKFHTDSSARKDLETLARTFITSGENELQSEALKMFSELPISAENIESLTSGLMSAPDPEVMKQALPEFQRYLGTAWEQQVHSFLSVTISTGAHFSSEKVSENILPFINSTSYSTYQQALRTMSRGAKAAANLDWALREYRRLQAGA